MEIPGKRLLAGALAALIAGGGAAAVQPVPRARAASRTVTETYASPRHGNETGLGTVWLYEAEKIQSSQSLTSGQYIAMTKDANGNYVGEAGNKATIRVNESQNKAAYPMAATIEENAVLTFAAPRAGTISVAETAARLDGWNPADFDGAGLSVYKDGERIWPAEGDNPVVTDTPVTVPALPDIAVEAGDKLRFVVDIGRVGGTQWGDTVIWPVTLSLSYEKGGRPTESKTYASPTPSHPDGQDTLWLYEGETVPVGSYFSGNFAPMTKQADGTYLGSAPNYKAKAGIQWDDGYLLKPNVEENAVRTFVVPQAGTVSIAASTASLAAWNDAWDGVGVAIYKDTTKLWPTDSDHKIAGSAPVAVPALADIAVEEGTKIRFVADVGGANEWGDELLWPVSLTLTSEADLGPIGTQTYTAPQYGAQYGLGTRWVYEAETFAAGSAPHSGVFSLMAKQDTVTEGGPYYLGQGATWGAKLVFEKASYKLQPNAEQNAVLTFISPGYGQVSLPETTVTRHGGAQDANDGAGLSIYLNDQKIWPADAEHQLVDASMGNRFTVPAIEAVEVEEGDALRFIVDLGPTGGNEWCDDIDWPASVTYTGSRADAADKVEDPIISEPTPPDPGEDDNSAFEAAEYKAPGEGELKWPDVWLFEYETRAEDGAATGTFTPMTVDLNGDRLAYGTDKAADFSAALHAQALFFTEKKDGYLTYPIQPGNTQNAAITFIAPKEGVIKIPQATVKRYGGVASCDGDGAALRILVDGRQVWPAEGETALVSNANHNTLTIPEIPDVAVNMDTTVRFVVDMGEANNWCDAVMWPAAVTYTKSAEDDKDPTDIEEQKKAMEFHSPTLENPALGIVWKYEYEDIAGRSELYSGVFGDMVKKTTDLGLYQGNRQLDEAAHALVLKKEGALPMRPGADQNAILTFVAPRAGTLNILATEAVRAGGGDGTGLSIILNRNQQLWPGDGAAFLLDDAGGNRAAVPAITGLQVEEGDLISFVADIGKVGGDNQGDEVVWPITIRYDEPEQPEDPGDSSAPEDDGSPDTGAAAAALPLALAAAGAGLLLAARGGHKRRERKDR